MFIATIYILKRSNRPVGSYDEGTSPNDASCVVWASGVCFLKFSGFFSILNYVYLYYIVFRGINAVMEGGDDENRPKRRVRCRLGHL